MIIIIGAPTESSPPYGQEPPAENNIEIVLFLWLVFKKVPCCKEEIVYNMYPLPIYFSFYMKAMWIQKDYRTYK